MQPLRKTIKTPSPTHIHASELFGTIRGQSAVSGRILATRMLAILLMPTLPAFCEYAYQASVSIPAASNSDQTNITLVIAFSDSRMKTAANGGAIQNTVTHSGQTVPADCVLSTDAAITNLYNWGWDSYDPTTGAGKIWLLMPTHSHTSATSVYISIGNPAVNTYQGGSMGA